MKKSIIYLVLSCCLSHLVQATGVNDELPQSDNFGLAVSPAAETEGDLDDVINLADAGTVTYTGLSDATVTVSGKTDLHLTGDVPLTNTTIDLMSEDSWLFLEAVKPSAMIAQYLETKTITVNGKTVVPKLPGAADNSQQNARIAIYGSGSVLIPFGNATDAAALQVFTEPNFGGATKSYPIFTRHTSLGTFNNAIRSFKLKRGYMATLANKVDGTGFSKVFIANDGDLEVNAMPKGLEASVSFIRVFRWDWVNQRGWAGGPPAEINATSFYDWSDGGNSTNVDWNYVMIKQKLGWPGDASFNNKANVTHLLGYNEPDHSEQHEDDNGGKPITVAQAIERWPAMMASGLRLGTPAPTDFNWLYNFLTECDKLNYRVDFVAIHSYWYTSMSSWRSQLKAVWDKTKRPVWITEWNNGANWTGHNFPDAEGPKCDADGNPILDGSGNTTTVTLPCSPANAAKQLNDIKNIVGIMEEEGLHIERYFIYNWVQDARSMHLGGKLTPAGKWYASNPSKLAFNDAYDHQWKLVATDMTYNKSTNTFTWKDYNGETAKGYLLERRTGNTGAWTVVGDTIPPKKSDAAGMQSITVSNPNIVAANYRYRAIGYDNSIATSASIKIEVDAEVASPTVTATPISSSWIKLEWNAVDNANSYRIYRATYPDSIYLVLRNSYLQTSYDNNTGLKPNTIYWYRVHSVNGWGESVNAVPVKAITKKEDGSDGDGITAMENIHPGKALSLLPNPVKANEQLAIHFDTDVPLKNITVEILNAEGKRILHQPADKTLYAPPHPGLYIVKITGQTVQTLKLIVQ
ncbi:MAG: T9SS type A sorting domain-containing protein [Dysgonamonadaceae bacterium]|jgi:hypothetical protein|nr:T9SS type A sorting domain-containing protein [Dysgonamonadaceae bacterium]